MNKKIEITDTKILSSSYYTLKKVTYNYLDSKGRVLSHSREVYDRGNGAGVLLYNKEKGRVLLVKQFRMPTYLNGNEDGMLIEVCAGLLDEADPDACIIREIKEETGYEVGEVQRVYESYMSPGVVTELLYLYVAAYDERMKKGEGGGVADEQEDIELLELSMDEAMQMVRTGGIRDAKTIMLLQYAYINKLL